MLRIAPGLSYPLYGVAESRCIEQHAQSRLPPNTLMQRAGLAVAQLALAVAPHAQRIWIACGPGNNGGDGLEAAVHLHRWGKVVAISWLGQTGSMPPDTAAAYKRVLAAGMTFANAPPDHFDLGIDALLGIGAQSREPQGMMADWIKRLCTGTAPVLSIDVPSGLNADTGCTVQQHVKAAHTLSLLTLKPGLLTAQGRDATGILWFDTLGVDPDDTTVPSPTAKLLPQPVCVQRPHGSHKGTFGDVAVVGGASGMTGAALLAASAALHAGAGRVFVSLLGADAITLHPQQPELMFRTIETLDHSNMVVVCGCGGGAAIQAVLPRVLASPSPVVMDADAINNLANDSALQLTLMQRSEKRATTVLTPHPLEAARLMGSTASQVQSDRLGVAKALSHRFACTVVLKGSGTIIASPGQTPMINPTGNARLASAGTGDVLAGMVGAALATGMTGFDAACHAVYQHGQQADHWPAGEPLTAGQLAQLRYGRP